MRNLLVIGVALLVVATAVWLTVSHIPRFSARSFPGESGYSLATSSSPVGQTSAPRDVPDGYAEYRNVQYGFSVLYPKDLSVQLYDEGGGATTFTFQDVQTAQGFQIFVLPYGSSQVTQAQFLKDEPSGVRQGTKEITIDGAAATSFYSADAVLGDTAEIWFIHDGYLFEVTTLKPLASWLSPILQTWQFL